MIKKITAQQARRKVELQNLSCKTIDDLKPLKTIIGQQRAMNALLLGLGMRAQGFNVYVSGQPGTGKLTAVKSFLTEFAKKDKTPDDWCYVHNFDNPYEPRKIRLPAGKGKVFKEDMRNLLEEARQALLKAFESDDFAAKREEIFKIMDKKKQDFFMKVERLAQDEGFIIKHAPGKVITVPTINGDAMTDDEFQKLSDKDKKIIFKKQDKIQIEIKAALRFNRELERESNMQVRELEEGIALFATKILIDELKEKYEKVEDVLHYLEQIQDDILGNLVEFIKPPKADPMAAMMQGYVQPFFTRYEVNVLIDNSGLKGAPVIIELNPTHNNLFGKVEKESQMGTLYTDFNLIRKGALHEANGGFLVIPVEDLLRNYLSWDGLKRAIRNKDIIIEDAGERLGFLTTKSLKPQPIPFDARIILLGEPMLYYLLYEYDSEFKELFKVKAEFDTSMEFSAKNLNDFLSFICKICKEENLSTLDNTALASVAEYACRLAEDRDKISTRFGEVADIIREAVFYAKNENKKTVTAKHIQKAINEKFYRSGLIREKIKEMISRGIIMIDLEEEVVGQVNGLAVIDFGDVSFGKPSKITVSTGVGRDGLLDIEREAKLGGPIHSKGVMILNGFINEMFGKENPVSLTASLVFEQSYSEVEGDSASSAELYSILSSLSGLPIHQGIAVTGSVNQKGEVQAIGGVNEKIEGFFDVCQMKGLTGRQGVMIPFSNLSNLMLKEEVTGAIAKGKFSVWAVKTIDEGIEVLTGVKAGKRLKNGNFQKDTVYDKVAERLKMMAKKMEKSVNNYRKDAEVKVVSKKEKTIGDFQKSLRKN